MIDGNSNGMNPINMRQYKRSTITGVHRRGQIHIQKHTEAESQRYTEQE
jgi:hypothetical protein